MEFSVYSQNGEDGILDFLIDLLGLDEINSPYPKAFVEFGVENYTESNTRYILKKRNWQGLVLDGSATNIAYIKRDELYWRYDLEAKNAFITRENINALLQEYLDSRGLENIALLSIDIDGMDYFVWEALHCINPAIVVVEYNAILGGEKSLSVPYKADFNRFEAHYSGLYFGASIKALINLGKTKGYEFVGADKSGTNLFFVNKILRHKLTAIKTHDLSTYCDFHKARQSRDKNMQLSFINGKKRWQEIEHLDYVNI